MAAVESVVLVPPRLDRCPLGPIPPPHPWSRRPAPPPVWGVPAGHRYAARRRGPTAMPGGSGDRESSATGTPGRASGWVSRARPVAIPADVYSQSMPPQSTRRPSNRRPRTLPPGPGDDADGRGRKAGASGGSSHNTLRAAFVPAVVPPLPVLSHGPQLLRRAARMGLAVTGTRRLPPGPCGVVTRGRRSASVQSPTRAPGRVVEQPLVPAVVGRPVQPVISQTGT